MATETSEEQPSTPIPSLQFPQDDGLDEALEKIGGHTCWTWTICFATGMGNVINAMNILAYVFFAEQPEFWCQIPELDEVGWSMEQQSTLVGSPDMCKIPDLDYKSLANMSYEDALKIAQEKRKLVKLKQCREFIFGELDVSMIGEFNLVCDRLIYLPHLQMVIILGMLLGSIVFGMISDSRGRKLAIIVATCIFFVAGPIPSLVPNYWVLLVARLFMGLATGGIYNIGLVLLLECVQILKRGFFTMMFSFFWGAGHSLVALVAYVCPDWRILHAALSVPGAVLFISCALIPESPPWLIVHNKRKEAWKIVTKADKTLVPTTEISDQPPPRRMTRTEKLNRFKSAVSRMMNCKELLKRLILASVLNFLAMATYNILSLNASNFKMNLYIYVAVSGGIEIACYTSLLFVLSRIGRRLLGIIIYTVGGTALVLLVVVPAEEKVPYFIFVGFAIICSASGLPLTFLICNELLPTEVRGVCLGIATAVARIGPVISPYVVTMGGNFDTKIPHLICAAMCFITIAVLTVLPETHGKPMRNTIEEVEMDSRQGYKVTFLNVRRITGNH